MSPGRSESLPFGRTQLRLQNQVRGYGESKVDRLIVASKSVKTGGAKGVTNKLSAEVKQGRFARFGTRGKRAEADMVSVGDIQQSCRIINRVNVASLWDVHRASETRKSCRHQRCG